MKSSGRIRGLNCKGYFHMEEPYCEEYLKAKHAVFEKSKRMRGEKENDPVIFEFNQPRSGYYAFKGCNLSILKAKFDGSETRDMEKPKNKRCNSEFLSNFIMKYAKKKLLLESREKSGIFLPFANIGKNQVEPSKKPTHSKSMFVMEIKKGSKLRLRVPHAKMYTEPDMHSLDHQKQYYKPLRKTEGAARRKMKGKCK